MPQRGTALVVASLALLDALPFGAAYAAQTRSGDWAGSLDTTLSYSVGYRMQGQDKRLIARANGGQGENRATINSDDGNLNFKKGERFSELLKLTSELNLRYQERYGVSVQGVAFHDFELMDRQRRHRQISSAALREVGSGAELLATFAYGRWLLGDRALDVRLGRQVVNWGETLFYPNSVDAINPIDAGALRVPGAAVKDAYIPTPMVYAAFELRDGLRIEGYWQSASAWEHSRIEPCGSFHSVLDMLGEGCDYLAVPLSRSGPGFDNPVQAAAYGKAQGFSATSLPSSVFISRGPDMDADNSAQYGVALHWQPPQLGRTEVGVYYLRYNMHAPMLGMTVGQPLPTQSAPRVSPVSPTYYAEYLEKRDLFGISFNTLITGDNPSYNLKLAGELSYRPDTPVALGFSEYMPAALTGASAGLAVGTRLDGYREKSMYQASLSAIYSFTGLLGADSAALAGEVLGSRVPGLESSIDYYDASADAYGAQARLQLTYANVFDRVSLVPRISYQHSIAGVAPPFTNGLDQGARSWSLGLEAIHEKAVSVGMLYVGYGGGGLSNKRADRDYLGFRIRYSF